MGTVNCCRGNENESSQTLCRLSKNDVMTYNIIHVTEHLLTPSKLGKR
jgi:hypothetical protein